LVTVPTRSCVDPARMKLLYGFFDMYLKLNDEEEKQVRDEISHLPKEEADWLMELPNYYYDKGMEEGRREAIERGLEIWLEKVVYNMFKLGYSNEEICNITELSIVKVKEIISKQGD